MHTWALYQLENPFCPAVFFKNRKDFAALHIIVSTFTSHQEDVGMHLLALERLALPVGCATNGLAPVCTPNLTGGAGPVRCGTRGIAGACNPRGCEGPKTPPVCCGGSCGTACKDCAPYPLIPVACETLNDG
jgi:hypothetical protein